MAMELEGEGLQMLDQFQQEGRKYKKVKGYLVQSCLIKIYSKDQIEFVFDSYRCGRPEEVAWSITCL